MAGFTVTTSSTGVKLGGNRQARVVFSFTNTAQRNLTARASVAAKEPAQASWFTTDPVQAPSPVDATQEVVVQVSVPKGVAPGTHLFALQVVGVENTDEFTGQSQWLSLEIPQPVVDRSRWLYALIAAVAVVLIGVIAFVAWKIFHHSAQPGNVSIAATVTDFGTVEVGHSGKISVVTVKNDGGSDSTVQIVLAGDAPADFPAAVSQCQQAKIKAGGTCEFELAFQPTAQGARKAVLQVTATSGSAKLDLTGTGQGVATLSFNPNSVWLKASSISVLVTNTGSGEFDVSQMILSDQTTFTLPSNGCLGAKLKPGGGQCQFTISTTYSGIVKTASLVFVGSPGGSQSLALSAGSLKRIGVEVCPACRVIDPNNFVVVTPKP